MLRTIILSLLLSLLASLPAHSVEWQWSVPTPAKEGSVTYLWIPPECEQIKGVVIGQHNMIEEGIFEHPAFRANLARLGLAEVWIVPPMDHVFRFDQGAGENIETLMNALAKKSGYSELAKAPFIPMGHSACASFPWNFAAWNPDRTLAILSIKGDAPLTSMTGSGKPNPEWGDRNIDGIPGLMVMGEYEWLEGRLDPAAEYRKEHPNACIAMLAEVGHGHFDISDDLVSFLNLFIQKAVDYRLAEGSTTLRNLDPQNGWLTERWKLNQLRTIDPAPYADYAGDKTEAFWAFDQETALAIHHYRENQTGRKPQLLGGVHNGQTIKQSNKHFQIKLPCDMLEADGITFKVQTTFLDAVGAGSDNLARWTNLPAGTPLSHAATGGPIRADRITGPVEKIAPDTFRIALNRTNASIDRRNRDIWLRAWHPGDLEHKSMVQQALMVMPDNKEGKSQSIDFPPLADVTNGLVFVELKASSTAGLPVRFFVKDGPAEIIGNHLYFTPIPLRAEYPVSVTVFAYQLGNQDIQSALMVERSFRIVKQPSA